MLYPLTFHPIFKERVWGGREIEKLYGKPLPPGKSIGESWEISDRPGDESVIANGKFSGKTLRWLMEHHRRELLGDAKPAGGNRFPILCKILDAREKLSLQVHPRSGSTGIPPAGPGRQDGGAPGGQPKTEMWYVVAADPVAELFVGLKGGVTRAQFEKTISDGSVAECFHRIPVRAGDAMFLPSGRVHAIGAGLVIFEIQQNSDTTYRVFDWNRVGLDGKPRELHVAQSLESIDFNDFEPGLVGTKTVEDGKMQKRLLVDDPLFNVHENQFETSGFCSLRGGILQILAVVEGSVKIHGSFDNTGIELSPGQFCLIPASLVKLEIETKPRTRFLTVEAG